MAPPSLPPPAWLGRGPGRWAAAAQSRGTVRSEQSQASFFSFFLSHESKPLYWEEKPNLDFMV